MDKTVKNEDQIGFYGSLEIDHGKISGEITSQFKEKMENCTVFFNDKLIYLGDVEPGQTVEVGIIRFWNIPKTILLMWHRIFLARAHLTRRILKMTHMWRQ